MKLRSFGGLPSVIKRNLNIHEFQSQSLMRDFGLKVPASGVATTEFGARQIADRLGGEDFVVKAMILAGGRGKGHFDSGFEGGVHVVKGSAEVARVTGEMLGHNLITKQTGPEGLPCRWVYVTERVGIDKEFYFAVVLDRQSSGPMLIASRHGGVNIEEVAEKDPSAVVRQSIDITEGPTDAELQNVVDTLQLETEELQESAKKQIHMLYEMFVKYDCTQIEINPLVLTSDQRVLPLDTKMNFDDNAEFRHPELYSLRDKSQEDPREVSAAKHDLNYIGLDGNIGCLVNGAGLAMATMDIIKLHGGEPANFLDIGGGATASQVTEALRILNDDEHVQVILVNIFGGIMRCDIVAKGLVQAVSSLHIEKPVVVRLQGTNMDLGHEIMSKSKLKILPAPDLDNAAKKAVAMSRIVDLAEDGDLQVTFKMPLI